MATTIFDVARGYRALSPAARTNGTVNGPAVDLGTTGAESALVVFNTGTITDGSHAFAVEESDASGSGFAAVPAARLQGTVPTVTAPDDDTQFEAGVIVQKRYLRVTVVTTGATTGGIFSAVIVAGTAESTPIAGH